MASAACCTLPPVQVDDYTPKGTFSQVGGVKTYITGPSDAKQAIVTAYDIFGFTSQALQGADLLASQGFKVLMPDVLFGRLAEAAWFHGEPGSEEEKKKMEYMGRLQDFVTEAASPFEAAVKQARSDGADKVGTLGFCLGAAIVMNDQSVDAIAMAHPSLLKGEDAKRVTKPICFYPTQDEDRAEMDKFIDIIKNNSAISDKSVTKIFTEACHGFCTARADFKNEKAKADYVEAHTGFAKFFKNTLA